MAARSWVAALQEAIDRVPEDESPNESHASPGVGTPPQPQQQPPAAGTPLPLQRQVEQLVVFGTAKADEFDRKLSGTLAQHAHKIEAQLAQMARDRQALAHDVTAALDGFHGGLGS